MNALISVGLPAAFGVIASTAALAMSPQELCDRVFEQYGVMSEECEIVDTPQNDTELSGLSDETQESHVFFARGGAQLDDNARLKLTVLVQVLETPLMTRACLHLVGHSDSSGSSTRNLELARERAQIVADALRAGLMDPSRILEVSAEGENRPLQGQQGGSRYNRRVEILARDCPE
ncbi:OmpA family protein [Shimia isoporae]|uniref:OmpA family protein n=1 Tax=Shimia isoporae TaxID=647720 RepID=A0A4V6NFK4_9RHOB|nr:OmpA family protein [Shimia isoporae]TCL01141.1 OmpA family protein [Shimia isoporae]